MKFRPVFRCWSCGATMPDGQLLDCPKCAEMLHWAEVLWKLKNPDSPKLKYIHIVKYKGTPWYWDRGERLVTS